jgi:hypothetical protein
MNNILRLALLIGIVLLAISFNGLIDKQYVISGYNINSKFFILLN